MVANPNDLVRGVEGPASADPAVATRAIDTFRKALPTGHGGTVVHAPNATQGSGPGGMAGMGGQ